MKTPEDNTLSEASFAPFSFVVWTNFSKLSSPREVPPLVSVIGVDSPFRVVLLLGGGPVTCIIGVAELVAVSSLLSISFFTQV